MFLLISSFLLVLNAGLVFTVNPIIFGKYKSFFKFILGNIFIIFFQGL